MPAGCSGEMLDARSWVCHSLPSSSAWQSYNGIFGTFWLSVLRVRLRFRLVVCLVISFALILPYRLGIFHRLVLSASLELLPNHLSLHSHLPPPLHETFGNREYCLCMSRACCVLHVLPRGWKISRDYPKSLVLLQFSKMLLYSQRYSNVCLVNSGFASLAPNSANSLVRKVA